MNSKQLEFDSGISVESITEAHIPTVHEENKMGTMHLPKLLFSMAIPAIFSMLIQAIYNIVDSIFVARISEQAMTAVTLVFPVQMLIIAVGVGTGIGLNSLISRRLGEKKQEEADSAANHGFVMATFHWVLFAIFGLFFARPFFSAYSDSAGLVDMATSYGSIITVFSLFLFIQMSSEKILQATGNMVMPMISNLIGCIVNIILDPIMIFGLLGCPAMGVAGAAWATIIGQFVGMCCILSIILFKSHRVKVGIKHFKFSWSMLRNIYGVGIPAMIMQAITSVLLVFLNKILISFSDASVAVLGVYFRLQSFVFMPVFGLTQGAMPILGYNFGARNKERFIKIFKLTVSTALVIMAVGFLIFQSIPVYMLKLFDASPEMMTIGVNALKIVSFCFIPAGFSIVVSVSFQAMGHGFFSLLMSLMRQMVLILPIAWVLANVMNLGPTGVWLSYPLAEIFSVMFTVGLFVYIFKKEIAPLDRLSTAGHDLK